MTRTIRDVCSELAEALLDYRKGVPFGPNMMSMESLSLLQQSIDNLVAELRHMAPEGTQWYSELVARLADEERRQRHLRDLQEAAEVRAEQLRFTPDNN